MADSNTSTTTQQPMQPHTRVSRDEYLKAIPTIKANMAAREAKNRPPVNPLQGASPVFIPMDVSRVIMSHLKINDWLNLRATSPGVERFMKQAITKLTFPRMYHTHQQHILALMFPGARTLKFQMIAKTNMEGWQMLFSVIPNPILDVSNNNYDVILDKVGRDLYHLGKFTQALTCFEAALNLTNRDLASDKCAIEHNIGTTNMELNQYSIAEPYFKKAYEKDNTDNATIAQYGRCLVGVGRVDEGWALIEQAVCNTSGSTHSLTARANAYVFLGMFDKACEDFGSVLAIDKEKTPELVMRKYANALVKLGRNDDASRVLSSIVNPMMLV